VELVSRPDSLVIMTTTSVNMTYYTAMKGLSMTVSVLIGKDRKKLFAKRKPFQRIPSTYDALELHLCACDGECHKTDYE